ncbi:MULTISPECIES: hypothetical protein [unclassified Microcoleus]|uniref:hypothetical protein n=1 Tax=unclassified Microcoleus TaxID=2642155 RepID=UPI001E0C9513|nr:MULTISPECIES: hypothetical protein [unclassified Microcoleus]MCC3444687.1 hypothetical protein [Microcoleus sp. PH2017_03_ELD_O_A]MCC3507439.1 hypothetical protein [Microcoleus sp. PH2017_19_SFW_U_A]TAE05216.1 MAG: hypothetical protein EAZ94_32605 [Oscillatoriales cyanobacterium]MCC3416207.1 hypothetical protein [Microcoleus sp. PH2017_02_FOX_O_A]MCC3494972.1 hypothetical protein [Microcoleus sp. PH2017_16_JOR_D_A]
MTASPQPTPESNILGNFASVVGLFSIALFFTGWIYRWSYFYCFQLNVITLDLPVESFFIVPLQVFLGDSWTIVKSAIAILLVALAIYLTLWLVSSINKTVAAKINVTITRWLSYRYGRGFKWIYRILKSWEQFNINRYNSIKLLRSLVDEIIIVGWVLLVLFWSAYHQGIADARRDAGENSSLPAVALIAKQDNIALGRKLSDVFDDKLTLEKYRFIGDKGLFDSFLRKEDTDNNPKEPRVWRLLLERGNWIYLFPALTTEQQKDPKVRPPVMAIQQSQSGDQLLIISPEPSKPSK